MPSVTTYCNEYIGAEKKFKEIPEPGWFSADIYPCPEQCKSPSLFYTKGYACEPTECNLSIFNKSRWETRFVQDP